MREIKFRCWRKDKNLMINPGDLNGVIITLDGLVTLNSKLIDDSVTAHAFKEGDFVLMQYIGFRDKRGLTKIYEGDIINNLGFVIGNIYENEDLLKEQSYFVVKGMGTKEWKSAEQTLNQLGCEYAQ